MRTRAASTVPHKLTTEVVLGRRYYVAAYAADPSITFRASTAEEAVRQLEHHMGELHRLLEGPRFPVARPGRPGTPNPLR